MALFRRKPQSTAGALPGPGPSAGPAQSPPTSQEAEVFAGGLEGVRPQLLPRLRRADQLADREDFLVRDLDGGFLVVLTVRTPNGSWFVRTGQVRRWNADPAELWSVALHNLRRESVETTLFQPGAGPVWQVRGGSWTATQLLRADELTGAAAPDGCIVAMPGENLLIVHPMVDANTYVRIMELQRVLPRLCGPHGFSDLLFHWHHGRLSGLRVDERDEDGKTVSVITGSAELHDVLNRLVTVWTPPAN
ncbi:hypothetical protein ACFVTC_33895 [Streptomyces sp. NPDC057950]|uniref:hypothetical protein n=1 Tax=Streptomyces sp. NPDC057950 TaxID=3346288 RepID=UPI0036EBBEED